MFKSILRPVGGRRVFERVSRGIRLQSTDQKNKTVDFRTFVTVAIFGSIILTQVVDAVVKEKPRGQKGMSEAEYYKLQQRLKRKVALFTPEEKEVLLFKDATVKDVNVTELSKQGIDVINPLDLVESEKNDKESKYYDLLNDPDLKQLPRGLTVELIGKALKNSPNSKFIVIGFPQDVKEAIQFEDKIVTVKNLVVSGNADDDVFKYYKTVNKSLVLDKDISSLF